MKPLVAGAIALCTVLPADAQEMYKWVDENGRVNYSSTPPAGKATKREVVEDRISVVPADPDLPRQADELRKREARRAKQAEVESQRRAKQAAAQPAPAPAPEYPYSDEWWYGGGYDYYPTRPVRPTHPIAPPRPPAESGNRPLRAAPPAPTLLTP